LSKPECHHLHGHAVPFGKLFDSVFVVNIYSASGGYIAPQPIFRHEQRHSEFVRLIVALAPTAAKARWATFRVARDAGYYEGRDGFSRFLSDVGHISEITAINAQSRISGHRPIGAPRDWCWTALTA